MTDTGVPGREAHERNAHAEPEEIRRARENLLRKMQDFGLLKHKTNLQGQKETGLEAEFEEYNEFVQKLDRLVERRQLGFKSRVITYAGVNTFLFLLNLFSSGLSFPWFIFPAGGWGIGLVSDYVALRGHQKVRRELQQLPAMKPAALKEFRALKKMENRHRKTAASFLSVGAFLVAINAITTGFAVPWSLIPVSVFGALYFGKSSVHKERTRKMRTQFDKLLQQQGATRGYRPAGVKASSGYEYEARGIADTVFAKLEGLEGVQQLSDEASNILHTYLEQVKLLSGQVEEIDTIMREIPKADIEADRRELEQKIGATESEQLKQEYRRSIQEIDQHIAAYKKLEEQRELIDLRIRSAINTLKKLRLDIARIDSVTQVHSMPHFDEIKRQSEDLSEYIQDLAAGYDETI